MGKTSPLKQKNLSDITGIEKAKADVKENIKKNKPGYVVPGDKGERGKVKGGTKSQQDEVVTRAKEKGYVPHSERQKPEAAKPETTKPETTKPEATKPETKKPTTSGVKSYADAYEDAKKKGWSKGETVDQYTKRAKQWNVDKYGTSEPTSTAKAGGITKSELASQHSKSKQKPQFTESLTVGGKKVTGSGLDPYKAESKKTETGTTGEVGTSTTESTVSDIPPQTSIPEPVSTKYRSGDAMEQMVNKAKDPKHKLTRRERKAGKDFTASVTESGPGSYQYAHSKKAQKKAAKQQHKKDVARTKSKLDTGEGTYQGKLKSSASWDASYGAGTPRPKKESPKQERKDLLTDMPVDKDATGGRKGSGPAGIGSQGPSTSQFYQQPTGSKLKNRKTKKGTTVETGHFASIGGGSGKSGDSSF